MPRRPQCAATGWACYHRAVATQIPQLTFAGNPTETVTFFGRSPFLFPTSGTNTRGLSRMERNRHPHFSGDLPTPARTQMWDYVVFLMFGVALYGFMWFSGVKATFFAHSHTGFKKISHLSRNSPAHLPPHRGTMARDLRWGLVFLSGSVDPDVQSLEKPEGLPEHSPGFPTLGLGSYNHHEP